jgi:arabinofuranan 3-O-arabinosyltransferase
VQAVSTTQRILRVLLVVLIPLALLEAWWVMPSRDPDAENWKEMDFAVFYTAGRMFAFGADPYDRADAEQVWRNAGGDDDVMDVVWGPFWGDWSIPADRAEHWLPVELIPPGLTVMMPFSILPVPLAWATWNVVVVVLLLGQLYATTRLMRRPHWDAASLAAILFTILLEPLHVGLANGQPTVPAVSLIVLALYWATSGREAWAGAAFAVATALKPQLAAPFVLLFMFQGKWRTVVVAAVIGAALTWAAAVPMQVQHPHWLHSWAGQLNAAEGAGNIDSARVDNPGRNDLLNLALIGHLFTGNALVVNGATLSLFFVAVAVLFRLNRHRRESLGTTAAFAVLVLLPMYHRFYDAGILVLAVGWALVHLRDRARWWAGGVLAVAAAFWVSENRLDHLFVSVTNAHGYWVVHDPAFARRITSSWWFDRLAQPHHAWELLAILGCLCAGLLRLRGQPEPARPPGLMDHGVWERHRLRLAVALLVPLAALDAWWISPDREVYKELDFAMYYTASRTFVHGGNPYDRAHAFATWTAADGDDDIMDYVLGPNPYDDEHPEDYWLPINCIPPALVVIAPFALLKVPVAWPAWNVVVGLLLLGQGLAVARLMRVPLWSVAALAMVIATILLDPLHVGLANGQPAVPAVSLTILACWLAVANWQLTAGVALAVATALKPQLAGPFALLFLWQRRFRAVVAAAVVGGVLTLAAVLPMTARHVPWLAGWAEEVHYAELPGGINDARRADRGRHDMVHLQVLMHTFTDNATAANAMTLLAVAGLGWALVWAGRGRPRELPTIAAFAILALLVAYHRLYDAGILVLPIGWAILSCRGGVARWPARVVLLLACVYCVQQEWLDQQFFGAAGRQPLSSAWWFDLFAEPHHQWELLAMFGCMVLSLRWQRAERKLEIRNQKSESSSKPQTRSPKPDASPTAFVGGA